MNNWTLYKTYNAYVSSKDVLYQLQFRVTNRKIRLSYECVQYASCIPS